VEKLGYSNVRALANSGNIVFGFSRESPDVAARGIEKALQTTLGVSARVVVLSAEELSEAIDANPFAKIADNSSRLLLGIRASPGIGRSFPRSPSKIAGRRG